MAKIITIGHLVMASKEARDTVIKVFEEIVDYSSANEPGVTMYAITVPTHDDGTTIYMIEEYADKATSDAHIASQPVQKLINLFTTEPVLAGAPTVYQLEPVYSFLKPEITKVTDPHIIFANIAHKAGGAEQSLTQWKEVISTLESDEQGALAFALCKEEADTDRLHTVEVYESKVEDSVAKTKDLGSSLVHVSLKMIGGFLHR
ncbi:hypothetical protein EDD37DRAFT_311480 [Exophiala viscosa]|uniref:uncharacterized protein n=1 Tax=Exophiala viscosa TaxID=2486360 RepID=UPI00219EE2E4|nr:hypothetical protein EDD37DRAFT_311480 [Exophiala viscosa]